MIRLQAADNLARSLGLRWSWCAIVVVAAAGMQRIVGQEPVASNGSATTEQLDFFEREIRPLLIEHCYECHSAGSEKLKAGLMLDSRQGLITGGDSGPAIDEMHLDQSPLLQAVRYESFEMPPKGKLPQKQIDALEQWTLMGAPWPADEGRKSGSDRPVFDLMDRKANHWVWQTIHDPPVPKVSDAKWPTNSIDHFILAELERANIQPTVSVDRHALLRRLYLDLIGLPPTPEQVQAFVADRSPSATESVVDRLLESPGFGERWGRHWLDLMRFAESRGHEFDNDASYAYQYRDYVIRAFNADLPYDQWVREQLAGDLLDTPRLHPTERFNESVLGTGFWHLGEWVHSPVDIRKDESDRFDNMIDVMSKAFLGVTVACARCHDHKFDAISTEDYYALSGFLQSSDYCEVPFESLESNRAIGSALAQLDAKYRTSIEALIGRIAPRPAERLRQLPSQFASAMTAPMFQATSTFADFEQKSFEFLADGELFGRRPRRVGEPVLAERAGTQGLSFVQVPSIASDWFWDPFEKQETESKNQKSSIAGLPRAGRTYRSPTFTLRDGALHCRVRGSGHVVVCVDSHRMIAGPLHGQTVRSIPASEAFQWLTLDLSRYVGHRIHLEFTPAAHARLEIETVLQGASLEQLQAIERIEADITSTVSELAQEIEGAVDADPKARRELTEIVQAWVHERTELQKGIRTKSKLAMGMRDGTGEDDTVLIRGNSSNPGKRVPRRFLAAIDGGSPMEIAAGSGRLQLAQRINDPDNPLTSRVIVNRLWHHLMGRGIVPTTDDFGVLGQRPTHPELLDHLATQFLDRGRSIKRMIRYIVLSSTYQLSSQPDSGSLALDPKNMLWHYHPPKRLEGEVIRDVLLSVAGRLDGTMGGPSIPVYLTPFMDGRGRPTTSGPLDGANRRSIYQEVRRNFLSPMMLTFDTPTPFSAMGRRNVSNVPAQALILMNDPLVAQLTTDWAIRACEMVPESDPNFAEKRIQWMYLSAYARSATAREIELAHQFLQQHATRFQLSRSDRSLWADVAHALVNKKEFIFQR